MPETGEHQEDPRIAGSRIVRFYKEAGGRATNDWLAREEPLEIRVKGESVAVTMRTPGHDRELAAGFLLSEGVIRQAQDVLGIVPVPQDNNLLHGNVIDVALAPGVAVDFEMLARNIQSNSSCGLCGKLSIQSVHSHFDPVDVGGPRVSTNLLFKLPHTLRAAQETFAKTGGLHAAAVFDSEGELKVLREDVGRHNAVDKTTGHALFHGPFPLSHHLLMVSGRTSFEIMQKALAARIPMVCAVSAPSSLAVEFARESGQTLVGFLREDSLNVYTGQDRVIP